MTDVTVALTVLNERSDLAEFLGSLDRQSLQPREVVIVDGGSTDGTYEVLQQWADSSDIPVRLSQHPGSGIAAGRNQAISLTRTVYVAVTDAGTILESNWLQHLVTPLEAGADVACGFFTPLGKSWMGTVIGSVTTPLEEEVAEQTFLPSSRSIAFRRQYWEDVGGYPEWLDYCEDLVFDLRLKEAGARFVFVPGAKVGWVARSSLWSFALQYYRYARGDGKAGLWLKRHLLRYVAYLALVLVPWRSKQRVTRLAVPIGYCVAHQWRYIRRVATRTSELGLRERALTLVVAMTVVLVGDVAKMSGYPVGVLWRLRGYASPAPSAFLGQAE